MREALRGFVIEAESLANTAQNFAHTVQGLAGLAQRLPPTFELRPSLWAGLSTGPSTKRRPPWAGCC